MTVFTRLRRVSDSSRFERCRVIGAATEAAYRPACCGALAIGIAMASAAAAAAVQVHSNSSRSCFSRPAAAWRRKKARLHQKRSDLQSSTNLQS